jgi:PBSX family phage terminase large subunit
MLGIQPPSQWPQGAPRAAYAASLRRLNIYDGSVSSAKTITSILRWFRWLREEAPPGPLMLAGRTESTIYRNVIVPIQEMVGVKHCHRIPAGGASTEYLILGRRHFLIGASDVKAEGKIRGATLAGCYGDEVVLWPESFFKMMTTRLRVEGAVFLGTTNPDTPAHWLNRDFLLRADELGLERRHFVLSDNPWLPDGYVDSLSRELTGLWHRRFIDGEWVVAEGAVYDTLGDDLLRSELPQDDALHRLPGLEWTVACVDYGTTNPTVFIALSMGRDQKLYAHHEWRHDSRKVGRQLTIPEQTAEFRKWCATLPQQPEYVYVDPSANALILQLHRDGVPGVRLADNAVLEGLQDVASLFANKLLLIHSPTMAQAWIELTSYAWDPEATAKGQDAPIKVDDHAPDALRYGIRGTRSRWRDLLNPVEMAA